MMCSSRPLVTGRLAFPRLWAAAAIAAASAACNATADTSAAREDEAAGVPVSASAPSESAASCAPDVTGLVPSGIEPIDIECPRGYAQRASFAALPVAGRFTTMRELTEAFCIEKSAASAPTTTDRRVPRMNDDAIDFEENDVVAYAFDARAGVEPALYVRGTELWLRLTTATCSGQPPELASVAFVVPKGKTINEQKCSLRCE